MPISPTPLSAVEFLALARRALGDRPLYEDALVRIEQTGDSLEVTRQPMDQLTASNGQSTAHLVAPNPVMQAQGDRVLRYHGEHCWLVEHLSSLCHPAASAS